MLAGGDGRDLLVGGQEADTVYGTAGDDLLVAGVLYLPTDPVAAVAAVRSECSSPMHPI